EVAAVMRQLEEIPFEPVSPAVELCDPDDFSPDVVRGIRRHYELRLPSVHLERRLHYQRARVAIDECAIVLPARKRRMDEELNAVLRQREPGTHLARVRNRAR